MGGLRDLFGHRAGGGVRLSEAEAPFTVTRRMILSGPEFLYRDSGPVSLCGGGWVVEIGGRTAGWARTLEKSATSVTDASAVCLRCDSLDTD